MELTVAVIAHGKAQATFDRHLPLWEAHGAPVMVFCPNNDPIKTRHVRHSCGEAAHHGIEANRRLRYIIRTLAAVDSEFFLIYEYDSFCLDPQPTLQKGWSGVLAPTECLASWIAYRYSTPPWMVDKESLELMAEQAVRYPAIVEKGYADRWFAAMAQTMGVPILGYEPGGFSNDTILPSQIPDMEKFITAGTTMFHGVKEEWMLKLIQDRRAEKLAV